MVIAMHVEPQFAGFSQSLILHWAARGSGVRVDFSRSPSLLPARGLPHPLPSIWFPRLFQDLSSLLHGGFVTNGLRNPVTYPKGQRWADPSCHASLGWHPCPNPMAVADHASDTIPWVGGSPRPWATRSVAREARAVHYTRSDSIREAVVLGL